MSPMAGSTHSLWVSWQRKRWKTRTSLGTSEPSPVSSRARDHQGDPIALFHMPGSTGLPFKKKRKGKGSQREQKWTFMGTSGWRPGPVLVCDPPPPGFER